MAVQLFGFKIGRPEEFDVIQSQNKTSQPIPSFAPPDNLDGAIEIASGGAYGTFIDLEGTAKNENELVTKYRELALQAEVEYAVDDIVNEAITHQDHKSLVEINLDAIDNLTDKVKKSVRDEFKTCLRLLDFQNMGYDIFRRWYVDGRLYYHIMIDEKNPRDGIKELRYLDPRRIRKVREPIRRTAQTQARTHPIAPLYNEYYMYAPSGFGAMSNIGNSGNMPVGMNIRISSDSIVYIHSGVLDQRNRLVLSYIHKAIKPMNQLRMLEDATVIYRLARAPERRIFYIDVGNLPKMKAEQYLRDMMTKHKNRLVYDASTGEVRDDRKFMTMLEDFWLPRREGNRGTEITTLPGGQNLGQMDDVEYFRRKLYKSLGVPAGRMQSEGTFNFGKSGEITRDEVKFSRFIDRLRLRFSHLFDSILETQLILRGVMNREEFKMIKENIHYDFLRDNYFAELKDQEVMNSRLGILQNIDPYVGKYFSIEYVRSHVLNMTEEDINTIEQQIANATQSSVDNRQPPLQPAQQQQQFPSDVPEDDGDKPQPLKAEQAELTDAEKLLIENMTEAINTVININVKETE